MAAPGVERCPTRGCSKRRPAVATGGVSARGLAASWYTSRRCESAAQTTGASPGPSLLNPESLNEAASRQAFTQAPCSSLSDIFTSVTPGIGRAQTGDRHAGTTIATGRPHASARAEPPVSAGVRLSRQRLLHALWQECKRAWCPRSRALPDPLAGACENSNKRASA